MSVISFIRRPLISDVGVDRGLGFGIGFNAVALVVQGGLRFGYAISVARVLGPSEYARFAVVLAIATVFSILWPAPAGAAFAKFVSRERGRGEAILVPAAARHLIRREVQFLAIGSLSVILFAMSRGIVPLDAVAGALLCVGIAGQGFGRGVHMSLKRTGREAALQISCGALALLSFHALMLAGIHPSPLISILGLALPFLVYSFVSMPRLDRSGTSDSALSREIDRFVVIAAFGSIASAGVIQLSIIVSAWLQNDRQAGQYAAAVSLALPLMLVPAALNMVLYPRMAAYSESRDAEHLRELRSQVTRVLAVVALVACISSGVLLPILAPAILGADFAGAVAPASILVLAVLATSVAMPSVIVMSTRTNRAALSMSIGAWVGLLVTCGSWSLSADGPTAIAVGYLAGTWTTGTIAVTSADRFTGRTTLPAWLGGSVGMASAMVIGSPALGLGRTEWAALVGLGVIAGAALILLSPGSPLRKCEVD